MAGKRLDCLPALLPDSLNDMIDYSLQRGPGTIISCYPLFLQYWFVLVGDYASADQEYVVATPLPNQSCNFRESCHVSAVEETHSYNVNILINRHLGHLFWCGEKTGVNDFHACIPERSA